MEGRDWLAMRPEDFDTDLVPDAGQDTLFDVTVEDSAPAEDGFGTGDLFADLP